MITRESKISDDDIIEAIGIRTAECFGAMNIANAFAGVETDSWYAIRHYSLDELKKEAIERGISFSGEHDSLKGEIWSKNK